MLPTSSTRSDLLLEVGGPTLLPEVGGTRNSAKKAQHKLHTRGCCQRPNLRRRRWSDGEAVPTAPPAAPASPPTRQSVRISTPFQKTRRKKQRALRANRAHEAARPPRKQVVRSSPPFQQAGRTKRRALPESRAYEAAGAEAAPTRTVSPFGALRLAIAWDMHPLRIWWRFPPAAALWNRGAFVGPGKRPSHSGNSPNPHCEPFWGPAAHYRMGY